MFIIAKTACGVYTVEEGGVEIEIEMVKSDL